jgi:hypothetical protein
MLYVILRIRWCHIIFLNVHASTEDKMNDVKDSFKGNSKVYSINSLKYAKKTF